MNQMAPKFAKQPNALYHSNKVTIYNFGVYDHSLDLLICFLYDETIASKGSNEVVSLLFQVFAELANNGAKYIFLSCDNCSKENKNYLLFVFLTWASEKFDFIIHLLYLEKGMNSYTF